MDKKVELQVLNISNSQAQVGAYAMVLGEVDGERQLPIIIGPAEAQATAICLKGIKAPRPLTHDLFYSCLNVLGATLLRVLIYKAKEGVFYSYIYFKKRRRNYSDRCPYLGCSGTGRQGRLSYLYIRIYS